LQAYEAALDLNPSEFMLREALRDLVDLRAQMGPLPELEEAERLLTAQVG